MLTNEIFSSFFFVTCLLLEPSEATPDCVFVSTLIQRGPDKGDKAQEQNDYADKGFLFEIFGKIFCKMKMH